MSWEDQGRQEHGWFGNGTAQAGDASPEDRAATMFDPANAAQRIDAIAYSAVAHMPSADRRHGAVAFDRPEAGAPANRDDGVDECKVAQPGGVPGAFHRRGNERHGDRAAACGSGEHENGCHAR
jgi:hypothetical protein